MYQTAVAAKDETRQDQEELVNATLEPPDHSDDLTGAFVRLSSLPTCPLDWLSRYEATLCRQACQILWTLQCLDRRKPWKRLRSRSDRDRLP
jgi:hypothetical protein